MKLDFSDSVTVTPSWNGNDNLPEPERMTATISPLSTAHLLDLLDLLAGMGVDSQDDIASLPVEQTKGLLVSAQKMLPQYVTLNNLFSPAGEAVTIETVINDARLMPLAVELFSELMEASQINEEDEGNL